MIDFCESVGRLGIIGTGYCMYGWCEVDDVLHEDCVGDEGEGSDVVGNSIAGMNCIVVLVLLLLSFLL